MKFWIKTLFWDRVKNTLALFGAPGGALAGYIQTDPFWLIVGVISATLAGVIAIWFTDHDKNGIIDLFEDK